MYECQENPPRQATCACRLPVRCAGLPKEMICPFFGTGLCERAATKRQVQRYLRENAKKDGIVICCEADAVRAKEKVEREAGVAAYYEGVASGKIIQISAYLPQKDAAQTLP